MFGARVVYDMVFFFVVIIIVLNLIFGVIIDTFAGLRSEKQQKEEILKNTCFICGMPIVTCSSSNCSPLNSQNVFNFQERVKFPKTLEFVELVGYSGIYSVS